MLSFVSGPEPVEHLAGEYLTIRFYFSPITLINYALLGYFIGKGLTHISLVLLVSANTVNGLLNYVFVYHLDMNSNGVAWGTNLSELLQLFLAFYFIKDPILKNIQWNKIKNQFDHFATLSATSEQRRLVDNDTSSICDGRHSSAQNQFLYRLKSAPNNEHSLGAR